MMGRRSRVTQRPEEFTIDPSHPWGRAAFLGLGRVHGTARFHDSSAYKNHGTLTNMTPLTDWVFAPYLGRWELSAGGSNTTKAVNLPAWNGRSTVSFSAWVKVIRGIGANDQITAADSSDSALRTFQFRRSNAGKLQFILFVANSPVTVTGGTTLVSGTRYHVAATNNGVTASVYVNGILDGGPTASGAMDNDAAAWALFGRYANANYTSFSEPGGLALCDFLRHDWSLSPSEIAALADPSNVMLGCGGRDLIVPARRRLIAVGAAGAPPAGNRRRRILICGGTR